MALKRKRKKSFTKRSATRKAISKMGAKIATGLTGRVVKKVTGGRKLLAEDFTIVTPAFYGKKRKTKSQRVVSRIKKRNVGKEVSKRKATRQAKRVQRIENPRRRKR